MNLRVVDRLSGVAGEPGDAPIVNGRYLISAAGPRARSLNSFVVTGGSYLVPDPRGHWQLLDEGGDRSAGRVPRSQMIDTLDSTSIRAVGQNVAELLLRDGTWLEATYLSPLVPGMSDRAQTQPLERLITSQIGHLEEVCRRPRTHLRVEVERTPVSRARRSPVQAASYLASHTEDWERPTLWAVIPKRILSVVRDDEYDIYENRVAARLVDNLLAYLGRRISEVSRLLGLFDEASDFSATAGTGSHWRQARVFRLWGDTLDASDERLKADRTLRQLRALRLKVASLKDSLLYQEVPLTLLRQCSRARAAA